MNNDASKITPVNQRYRYSKAYRLTKAFTGLFFLLGLGIAGSLTHSKSTKAVIEAVVYIFVILSGLVLMKRPKGRNVRSNNQKLPENTEKP